MPAAHTQSTVKRCQSCGKDVAGRKRMKDGQGHYWCIPCGLDHQKNHKGLRAGKSSGTRNRQGSLMLTLRNLTSGGDAGASRSRTIKMILLLVVLAAIWLYMRFG